MDESRMRAIQYDAYGPADVLRVRTVSIPRPGPGAVLVRVAATRVNAADVTFRSGKLRLISGRRFPRGTGFDFAGEVVEVGAEVTDLAMGQGVWGFVLDARSGPLGAAADYVVAPAGAVATRPRSIDAVSAAALPGAAGAALGVLRDVLGLRAGERVLVRGAAGGVGTAAVQIAHAMGAHVTALARAEHTDALREIGADEVFDYRSVDPRELGRFDVVLDLVSRGMRTFRRLLGSGGRMAAMAVGGPADLAYVASSGVFGARRVRFVQSPPTGRLLTSLAELVDNGSVRPVVEGYYALEDIAAAHRALEHGGGFGKRVIKVS